MKVLIISKVRRKWNEEDALWHWERRPIAVDWPSRWRRHDLLLVRRTCSAGQCKYNKRPYSYALLLCNGSMMANDASKVDILEWLQIGGGGPFLLLGHFRWMVRAKRTAVFNCLPTVHQKRRRDLCNEIWLLRMWLCCCWWWSLVLRWCLHSRKCSRKRDATRRKSSKSTKCSPA